MSFFSSLLSPFLSLAASPKLTKVFFATTTPPIRMIIDTFEMRILETSPKKTTLLRFVTTTLPVPVTVDIFETPRRNCGPFKTRKRETSLKVTIVLTPRILVTVDTFGTGRYETSPKVMTALRPATTTLPIPAIVDSFETRRLSRLRHYRSLSFFIF